MSTPEWKGGVIRKGPKPVRTKRHHCVVPNNHEYAKWTIWQCHQCGKVYQQREDKWRIYWKRLGIIGRIREGVFWETANQWNREM